MTKAETICALKAIKVETGSLSCLGCGHESRCSVAGCAIIRRAIELLERNNEEDIMKKTCTRPDWSDEKNDYCMCDNLEAFAEVYGGSCEECRYWTDKEEQE